MMDSMDGKLGEPRGPMDLPYMQKIRFRLHLLHAWPHSVFGERRRAYPLRHNKFLFCVWFTTLILQIRYIYVNTGILSFFELGHNYITALMTTVDVHRITLPWMSNYRQVAKEFVEEIHLFHHKDMSEYAMKTYQRVNRLCSVFTVFIHVQMCAGVVLFNVTPWLNNVTSGMFARAANRPVNGTFAQSVYYELPFDYKHKPLGYLAVFLANCVLTYDAGCCFCVFDLYISLIIFHVRGHLDMLAYHLNHFPPPAARAPLEAPWYSDAEMADVERRIRREIDHHRLIMDFVRKTSDAFSPMLCVYFAFHQVCGCILLLEVSRLDSAALGEYAALTLIMFQELIQISIVFELLASKSEILKDAVYAVPWECMPPSLRKNVAFLLYNVQDPISLKALGMVPVGVQTMAAILKTSVSYFVMLRTMSA